MWDDAINLKAGSDGSYTQAKADIWHIKSHMGLLTAAKGLWRSLSPGETREVILQRLQKGMSDENIKLPEPILIAVGLNKK